MDKMDDDDVMARSSVFFQQNKQDEDLTANNSSEGKSNNSARMEFMISNDDFNRSAWTNAMHALVQSLADDTKQMMLLWNEAESDLQKFLSNEWGHLKTNRHHLEKLLENATSFEGELKQEKAILETKMKQLVMTLQKGTI